MYTNIPKSWLNRVYLGDEGPLAGQYAEPCPCGEPVDEGESCFLIGTPRGFILMHRQCVPSSLFEEDDDA